MLLILTLRRTYGLTPFLTCMKKIGASVRFDVSAPRYCGQESVQNLIARVRVCRVTSESACTSAYQCFSVRVCAQIILSVVCARGLRTGKY